MSSEAKTQHLFPWKHRYLPVLLFLAACGGGPPPPRDVVWNGEAFGTYYQIKTSNQDVAQLIIANRFARLLDQTNSQMSNWLPDSEVSRFNTHASTEPFAVSPETALATERALALNRATGGVFDPTLSPLIELWGFGTQKDVSFPDATRIEAALAEIGGDKLAVTDGALVKSLPTLALNLSAIAKGFAVDQVAALLEEEGLTDYMVNIGGEVRVRGINAKGKPWRMAVERPSFDAGQKVYAVFDLGDKAMATSGDYRNFFTHEGQRYSHIIDPRTGYPVTHQIASASVIAPDCMTADALATALLVLTPEEGVALIEGMDGIECLILTREADDSLTEHASKGLGAYRLRAPD